MFSPLNSGRLGGAVEPKFALTGQRVQ